jgi:hypothetical protein
MSNEILFDCEETTVGLPEQASANLDIPEQESINFENDPVRQYPAEFYSYVNSSISSTTSNQTTSQWVESSTDTSFCNLLSSTRKLLEESDE